MDKWPEKFILGLLAFISIMSILLVFKVSNLDKNIVDLTVRTSSLENDVSNISNNISNDITTALEKKNSLVNEFKYNIEDIKGKNVLLELRLLPKKYSSENKYYFSFLLKDDSSKLIEAKTNSANYLVSTVEVPLQEDVELNYIEENENGKNLESLEMIYGLEEEVLSPFNSIYPGQYNFYPNNTSLVLDDTFEIYYDFGVSSYNEDKGIESAKLYLDLDGEIVDSFPMKKGKSHRLEEFEYTQSDNTQVYKYSFKNYKKSLKKDDKIEIYAIAKHSKGFKVKIPLGKIGDNSNGEMEENVDPDVLNDAIKLIFED